MDRQGPASQGRIVMSLHLTIEAIHITVYYSFHGARAELCLGASHGV